MRLVKIGIDYSFVVDADNPTMVNYMRDAVYEDVCAAVNHDEIHRWIKVLPAPPDAAECDIPQWVTEMLKDLAEEGDIDG